MHDKNLLAILLIAEMLRIISGIKALADDTSDTQLAGSVNYTRSKLERMSDTSLFATGSKIKTIADDHAAALVDYGITAPILANYALDLTAFDSIIKKPKAMQSQLKMYTGNLKVAVKDMLKHLRNSLDNLIKSNFPGTDFETAYFNSRVIYNYGQNATGLIGNIMDASTEHKIKDVIVEIVNYPAPGQMLVRSTNERGHYAFKRLDATKVTVRVRALGYTTAEYEVALIKDQFKEFNIQLMPEPAPVPVNA